MVVWMEISRDKYELPLIVAFSARELADACGVKLSTVKTSASKYNTGRYENRFCRFRSVKIEDE